MNPTSWKTKNQGNLNDMFMEMLKEFIECVNSARDTRFNLDDAISELNLLIT